MYSRLLLLYRCLAWLDTNRLTYNTDSSFFDFIERNAMIVRLKCHLLYCDKRRSWNWAKKMRQLVEDWESHRPWLPIVTDPISRQRPHRSPAPYPLAQTNCWTVLLLRPLTAVPPLPAPRSSNNNNISSALQQPIEELLPAIRWPHGPSSVSRFDSRVDFPPLRKEKTK